MKSFLEGRPVVSRNGAPVSRAEGSLPSLGGLARTPQAAPPQLDSTTVPALGASTAPAAKRDHSEKKIETVEVDGVVQKIVVVCGCGERIEVHCGY